MTYCADMVRFGLASHLRVDLKDVRDDQRLREDLGLAPLDLVWVVMRVEAMVPSRGELPVEPLLKVKTVGELISAFDEWLEKAARPAL